jgi:hypothetical protein
MFNMAPTSRIMKGVVKDSSGMELFCFPGSRECYRLKEEGYRKGPIRSVGFIETFSPGGQGITQIEVEGDCCDYPLKDIDEVCKGCALMPESSIKVTQAREISGRYL